MKYRETWDGKFHCFSGDRNSPDDDKRNPQSREAKRNARSLSSCDAEELRSSRISDFTNERAASRGRLCIIFGFSTCESCKRLKILAEP